MSIFALLPAVRDRLRSQLSLKPEECRVMPGPKPPASCGDLFCSVFAVNWNVGMPDLDLGLDENYDVACCLSIRSTSVPEDDQGEELYIQEGLSLESKARQIMVAVHKNYDLIIVANNLISSGTKIIEPLRWLYCDSQPVDVGPDWYGAQGDRKAGMTMTVNFGRARRIQTLTGAT